MDRLLITHYYYPGTDPRKNIMNLPEEEAFWTASELAAAYSGKTSFGRFAEFENYYPCRKKADAYVRETFIRLGGKPVLQHPYSFTLTECEYLRKWFDAGERIVLDLSDIPDDRVSFTLGDSCALLTRGREPVVLTKAMLLDGIRDCGGSAEAFQEKNLVGAGYIEVQLWDEMEKYPEYHGTGESGQEEKR